MSDFVSDMQQLDGEWADFEPRESTGDFGPQLGAGQHQALLVDIAIRQRQSDEHWQLYLKWQNRYGSIRAWRDLDHEVGRSIAMNDLAMLGFEGQSWAEAQAAVDGGQLSNQVCAINVKITPGDTRDFTDVYLNGVSGPPDDASFFDVDASLGGGGGGADFPAASDDDIPF